MEVGFVCGVRSHTHLYRGSTFPACETVTGPEPEE